MEKLIDDFSFGLFFWQAIILLVLISLLVKFAWSPILNALEEREKGIEEALASAEKAKQEMEQLQTSNEQLIMEARQERDAMLKEAQTARKKIIAEASEEAGKKAAEVMEKAQASIEAERRAAIADIKSLVAELSIEIAEKVIREELKDNKSQMALVNKMLDEVKLN
jgi:F-type H+-transporting ATPase subunit b